MRHPRWRAPTHPEVPVDIERTIGFILLLGLLAMGLGAVFNSTLSILARWRRKRRPKDAELMDARLSRIEAAVEAIAIEVERQGELQRLAARVDQPRFPEPRRAERSITPH